MASRGWVCQNFAADGSQVWAGAVFGLTKMFHQLQVAKGGFRMFQVPPGFFTMQAWRQVYVSKQTATVAFYCGTVFEVAASQEKSIAFPRLTLDGYAPFFGVMRKLSWLVLIHDAQRDKNSAAQEPPTSFMSNATWFVQFCNFFSLCYDLHVGQNPAP